MKLCSLLLLIIASSFINSCNESNSGDAPEYTLSNEIIFFEKIIDSFLRKGPAANEPLLVELIPFRIDTTLKEQEWEEWMKEQDQQLGPAGFAFRQHPN